MIKLENISFSYTNKLPYLIDNVSLNLEKGSYISVIGENGSSKTTLMKLILNLLKPSKGTINIFTEKISYVPQRLEGFNSDFPISVSELLKTHLKALKIKDKTAITKALKKVNMEDFKNSLIGNLSGGQQQRVFIARALLGNPDLIVLDEPATGIDSKNQDIIYAILKSLNKNEGKTILSVEHNLNNALKYSTHILHVISGTPTLYTVSEYLKLNKKKII